LIELVKAILAFLKKLFFEKGLRETLAWLIQGSPLVLRLAVLFFLFLSVIFSVVVVTDISETNNVMIRALSSPIESAPRPSSAIEALLLASVLPARTKNDSDQHTGHETLPQNTPEFSAELKLLKDELAISPKEQHGRDENETKDAKEALDKKSLKEKQKKKRKETANDLRIVNGNGTSLDLSDAILSDQNDGFLFVPGAILPAVTTYNLTTFFAAKNNNEAIGQDIAASQQLAPELCGTLRERFNGSDVVHSVLVKDTAADKIMPRYVQAYLAQESLVYARLVREKVGRHN
jgi:hypothetical protein